jgi:hypothetical protein
MRTSGLHCTQPGFRDSSAGSFDVVAHQKYGFLPVLWRGSDDLDDQQGTKFIRMEARKTSS